MRSHPLLAFATTLTTASLAAFGTADAAQASATSRPPGMHLTANPNQRSALSTLIDNVRNRTPTTPHLHSVRHFPVTTKAVAQTLHRFAPLGGIWAALRNCESANNYGADTGNGYYGAYQFSLATWRGLGNSGLPSAAAPAQQDASARRLQAIDGWRPWPVCSIELGL